MLCLVNHKEITLLLSCSQLHPDEVSKIISQTRGSSDNDLLIKKHRKLKPKWSGKPQHIWNPRSTKGQRSISLLKKLLEEYNFDVWSWNSTLNLRPYARETSARHLGVVRLYVNAGYFSTTARRVASPTWGPPHPRKKALKSLLKVPQTILSSWSNFATGYYALHQGST